jgi:hypothetical protein
VKTRLKKPLRLSSEACQHFHQHLRSTSVSSDQHLVETSLESIQPSAFTTLRLLAHLEDLLESSVPTLGQINKRGHVAPCSDQGYVAFTDLWPYVSLQTAHEHISPRCFSHHCFLSCRTSSKAYSLITTPLRHQRDVHRRKHQAQRQTALYGQL